MTANVDTLSQGLGGAVRAEMARRKLPLKTLVPVLGKSWPTISSRINGHTPFNADEIDGVAELLGISPYELIESANPNKPTDSNVARITPQTDSWEQPARSKARRTA